MKGKVPRSNDKLEPFSKPHLDLQPRCPRQPAKHVLPDRIGNLKRHLWNRRSRMIVDHRLCEMKNRGEKEAQNHGDERCQRKSNDACEQNHQEKKCLENNPDNHVSERDPKIVAGSPEALPDSSQPGDPVDNNCRVRVDSKHCKNQRRKEKRLKHARSCEQSHQTGRAVDTCC